MTARSAIGFCRSQRSLDAAQRNPGFLDLQRPDYAALQAGCETHGSRLWMTLAAQVRH